LTPTKKAAAIASSVIPLSRIAWKARNWSSGCNGARSMFSASDTSSIRTPLAASDTMQGTSAVRASRFCFTSSSSARKRRPPAGTSNMPVSLPSASRMGRTCRLWISPRRAIDSASSSIESPAFTRRTFDWLSTSLPKGMSREHARVIFWVAVIVFTP